MDFINALEQTANNVSTTENGMRGYKTTLRPILDMNFKISSYRDMAEEDIINDFAAILQSEENIYALKFLFMVRDVREGLGERRFFRVCLKHLLQYNFNNKNEIIHYIITEGIPLYGRFDDLFVFFDTQYEEEMMNFVENTLYSDVLKTNEGYHPTLLAKWMPSVNASSPETVRMAYRFIKHMNVTPRTYRKMLSNLRAHLNVTEVYTSANEWSSIDYNTVPSKANLKYERAFCKHDGERRTEYLNKVLAGDKSVHMNGTANYPHEVVHRYMGARKVNNSLEALWKNLKESKGLKNTIVVRDGSGSMTWAVGNSSVKCIEVSTALAIYCAEHLEGTFKNHFITFAHNAELIKLYENLSLFDKLRICDQHTDCTNTDLENVFRLILNTAVTNKITEEEMPKQILIISDMEFDPSYDNLNSNVIETMQSLYSFHGYKLPKLIFWNVCGRSNTIPCKENELGLILMSGFSVNALKMLESGDLDPFNALVSVLNDQRYNEVPMLPRQINK